MKAIILAGGFAKRLWPLTKNRSKCLLPIAGKPMLDYVIEKVHKIERIDEIYVSTNKKFTGDFEKWKNDAQKKTHKKITIVAEPSMKEEEKLGAVGGLNFLIRTEEIDEDCLIVAGDNLTGLNLKEFIQFFKQKRAPVVAFYDIRDLGKAKFFGVVSLGRNKKIIEFEEKPEVPRTTLISTGYYIFPKKISESIQEYVRVDENKDMPGLFVKWLCQRTDVFGFVFKDYWFDIGSLDSLKKAEKFVVELQKRH